MSVLATPFHPRIAELNLSNDWTARGSFTAPTRFVGVEEEAMTARFTAVLFDTTPTDRVRIHGDGAIALLSAASGVDVSTLKPGMARQVVWRTAAGGVRSVGSLHRFGENNFTMTARDLDIAWISAAAPRFGAEVRDETTEKGVLLLIGPAYRKILAAAGLDVELKPQTHFFMDWKGINLHVSAAGALTRAVGGINLTCNSDDAPLVFDRIWLAGRPFGLRVAGASAGELLHLEAGVVLMGLDVPGARAPGDVFPTRAEIGLDKAEGDAGTLAGLIWDSDIPAPFSPIFQNGVRVGQTWRSAYSPALRRAIALAQLPARLAAPGNPFNIRLLYEGEILDIPARTVALPFVPFAG